MRAVATFKGIEALLGGKQLKKGKKLRETLRLASDFLGPVDDAIYQRRYEVCEGLEEMATLEAMIGRFLDIRNTTAAHANRQPPRKLQTTRARILEIQSFLLSCCAKALGEPKEHSLPPEAYLGSLE